MSSAEYKDYYAVLGIKKTADANEIKTKFRQLALKYHPDRNQGNKVAETKFKEISEAYDVLADGDKRAKYDRFGQYWEKGSARYPNTRTQNNNSNKSQVDLDTSDFSQYGNFDEFINELLGNFSSPKSNSTQTQNSNFKVNNRAKASVKDNNTTIYLTYWEAFHGTTKHLKLGSETVEVRIPAGAKPGSRIRLPGKSQPSYASPKKDLYLNVKLADHPFFNFEGDNLVCEVPVTPDEAVLGTSIYLPTPDGRVSVKIPAGINSGQVLRLREKGWSSPRGDRSDQLVRIVVVTPQSPNSQIKACYEKIRDLRRDNPRNSLAGIKL